MASGIRLVRVGLHTLELELDFTLEFTLDLKLEFTLGLKLDRRLDLRLEFADRSSIDEASIRVLRWLEGA